MQPMGDKAMSSSGMSLDLAEPGREANGEGLALSGTGRGLCAHATVARRRRW